MPWPRLASSLIACCAFAAGTLTVPSPASAAEPVRSAADFVDSIGVNIHWTYMDTAYADRSRLIGKLQEAGIRHVRDGLSYNTQYAYDSFNQLAAKGIKTTFIMGDPTERRDTLDQLVTTLRTKVPNAAEAVEGPNEYSYSGRPAWASELRTYQARLYDRIKSDSSLVRLPVLAPSLISPQDHGDLGDISGSLDMGNKHSYPNALMPESNVDSELFQARRVSGQTKPVAVTESGYHNGMNSTSGHRPISEEATATYMPRMFLEYFRRGIPRTFTYELIDEWADPNKTNLEANFGLLRNDYSEKPAFKSIKNLISLLQDTPGASVAARPLDYSLTGAPTDLRQMVLQKSDGSRYLVLWRAVSVWNRDTKTAVTPDTRTVTVSLPGIDTSTVSVAEPVKSAALSASTVVGGGVRIALKGDPVVLRIASGSSTSTTQAPTTPAPAASVPAPIGAPAAPVTVPTPKPITPFPVTTTPAPTPAPAPKPTGGRVRVPSSQRIPTVLRRGLVLDCLSASAADCRAAARSGNTVVASAGSALTAGRSHRLRLRLNAKGRRMLRAALRRRRPLRLSVRAQVGSGATLLLPIVLTR